MVRVRLSRYPWLRCAALPVLYLLMTAATQAAQSTTSAILGVVTDEEGATLAGVTIVATGDDGTIVAARTAEDGRFRLLVLPGARVIQFARGATGHRVPVVIVSGGTLRMDVVLPGTETGRPTHLAYRLQPVLTVALDADGLTDLPLDRGEPGHALLSLVSGVAGGSAFGTAAEVGTPHRLDGLDLTDPRDGRAWTSFILPAAAGATVRAGVGAGERDGSGAVLDVVTRAGGSVLRGSLDVVGNGRAWSRDALPEAMRLANPRLADRDRVGRSLRLAAVVSGPLTPHLGFGIAAEHAEDRRGETPATVTRTPRMHGRVVWAAGPRTASVVAFVDRRVTSGDVPLVLRPFAAPGLENEQRAHTVATRGTWQGPLRGALRVSASLDLLHGSRTTRPTSDALARQDDVTGLLTGSLGLVAEDVRSRTVAGGALDWRTARMGGHDLRVGADLERTQVADRASFPGGEFFHDLAGRPDTVDVWAGTDRDTQLGRETIFATDTWTPRRCLAVVAGVRAARLHGGTYAATSVQPRLGVTLAVDRSARIVARASAGVAADPLLATQVDRTVAGETPVISFRLLPDGRRVELSRTTPTLAGVRAGIRHPEVRELTGGADVQVTGAVQVGGTVFVRRFRHAIDTVYPDARWLAVARPGLDGRALPIYRWLNRGVSATRTIDNVDGFTYRAADGEAIGTARADRDYAGVIAHARVTLPRDRGSVVVSVTSARSRGGLDDTHDAGIGRSDRFASPTAALNDVDGPSSLTPDQAITVFGTSRVPRLPIRLSGIYQRRSGRRYAAQRTFGAATLDVPFEADGRTALLEPRGSRTLDPVDELSLRIAVPVRVGRGRSLEVYADVHNVLARQAVTAVETQAPAGVTSGVPLPFEAPLDVQRPLRVVAGGRLAF
jgi:hypothetical protein